MRKKIVSVGQIQALDRKAINDIGIPSLCLMENAGRAVADEVIRHLKRKGGGRVAVFCGLGNNAGDGFVAARHLINAGVPTDVVLAAGADRLKRDALVHYAVLKNSGCRFRSAGKNPGRADTVVDALFGVGLSRPIEEPFGGIIRRLNASGKDVIAVDIPSGLDGTTGKIFGVCVRSVKTVTFTCAKKGFYKNDGPRYAGKVIVADIGIPLKAVGVLRAERKSS